MDQLGFNSGNLGILESTREYLGITRGSYRNDLGMTREYLGGSGRVRDMTGAHQSVFYRFLVSGQGDTAWLMRSVFLGQIFPHGKVA